MIIECISCNKKFSLNDALMPIEGSKVRCGGCSEVWFYHPTKNDTINTNDIKASDTNLNDTQEDLNPSVTENTELANINDEVVLLGNSENNELEITVFDIAKWNNTIEWEILTNINERLERVEIE